jgi:hypothetical protein
VKRLFTKKALFFLILIISAQIFLACNPQKSKGVYVERWDNIYEGSNIRFYYENFESGKLKLLKEENRLKERVTAQDEFEAALQLNEWIHEVMIYSKTNVTSKSDAISILEEIEKSKKASDRDFVIVYSQAAASLGLYVRRGEFGTADGVKADKADFLKVVEVWSDKYNKWILIDVANNSYITEAGIPVSALELLNRGFENMEVMGVKDSSKYIKAMSNVLYTYTIEIDNNIDGIKRSNSFITYLKPELTPQLRTKNGYIPPTIFVNSENVFSKSPKIAYKNDNSDTIPTLILMKKSPKDTLSKEIKFACGVFLNSAMIGDYYVSINDSPWTKASNYFDFELSEGINKVKISVDGKNPVREVVIKNKE